MTTGKIADRRLWCLGSSQRLKILALLAQGYSVEGIAQALGTTQPTISYHIRQLRLSGLVRWEGLGRYTIEEDAIRETFRQASLEAGLRA